MLYILLSASLAGKVGVIVLLILVLLLALGGIYIFTFLKHLTKESVKQRVISSDPEFMVKAEAGNAPIVDEELRRMETRKAIENLKNRVNK